MLNNIRLYSGFFDKTLQQCAVPTFSFVHLDCDAYEPYRECLAFFYPRLARGGIILLDEYNDPAWPGCNKAMDEFLSNRPERLQVIAKDNYEKYYIVDYPPQENAPSNTAAACPRSPIVAGEARAAVRLNSFSSLVALWAFSSRFASAFSSDAISWRSCCCRCCSWLARASLREFSA